MLSRLAIIVFAVAATPALADGLYIGAETGVTATDDIVDTERTMPCGASCIPGEASPDGLRLDARETAWSVFAGWDVMDWLSLELAYSDLGKPEETLSPEPPVLYLLPPGVQPELNPDAYFNENPPAAGIAQAFDFGWVALGVQEISVNAVFRHGLTERFSAWWLLGVSRASFDARGYLRTLVPTGQPGVVEARNIPFATPDDETGYRWGFGAEYALNERFSLELGYRRHELQVIATESLSMRFLVRL